MDIKSRLCDLTRSVIQPPDTGNIFRYIRFWNYSLLLILHPLTFAVMSSADGNVSAGGGMPPGAQLPPNMNSNVIFEDLPKIPNLAKAHGILMGLAFVVVFPLGSFIIRSSKTRNMIWFHTACQLVGWGMMLGGLATGIKMGNILDRVRFICIISLLFC